MKILVKNVVRDGVIFRITVNEYDGAVNLYVYNPTKNSSLFKHYRNLDVAMSSIDDIGEMLNDGNN